MPLERADRAGAAADERPTLIVPTLERPLAAPAPRPARRSARGLGRRRGSVRGHRRPAPAGGDGSRSATGPGRPTCSRCKRLRSRTTWISASASARAAARREGPTELDALRRAAAGADAALADVLGRSLEGRTERDVAATSPGSLAHGHASVDFTIVGVRSQRRLAAPRARRSHDPAGRPRGPRLRRRAGRLLQRHDPYRRRRRAVRRAEAVHGMVARRAARRRCDTVRPGVEIQEVDRAARRVIADAGLRRPLRPPDGSRDRPRGARAALRGRRRRNGPRARG